MSPDKSAIRSALDEASERRRALLVEKPVEALRDAASVTIPLTTVSLASNFDAFIDIRFAGDASGSTTSLLVDSGNSTLIVPSWEHIQNLPGYEVLAEGTEPWGSPAKIVRGRIDLPTADGNIFSLPDCIFYACTGAPRTANFGAGCLVPWSASGWNTPSGLGAAMQAPLSYNTAYPIAEFNYAAAANIFALGGEARGGRIESDPVWVTSQWLCVLGHDP